VLNPRATRYAWKSVKGSTSAPTSAANKPRTKLKGCARREASKAARGARDDDDLSLLLLLLLRRSSRSSVSTYKCKAHPSSTSMMHADKHRRKAKKER
jgi:hypothetical protein